MLRRSRPDTNQQTERADADLKRVWLHCLYCEMDCLTEIQNYGGLDLWNKNHIKKTDNILVVCMPEYFQEDECMVMEKRCLKIEVDSRLLKRVWLHTLSIAKWTA